MKIQKKRQAVERGYDKYKESLRQCKKDVLKICRKLNIRKQSIRKILA